MIESSLSYQSSALERALTRHPEQSGEAALPSPCRSCPCRLQGAPGEEVAMAGPCSAKQGSLSLFVSERWGLGGESDALH